MKTVGRVVIIVLLGLIYAVWNIECIRCHTDDGPSPEEVKKIVRTCMNKLEDHNKHGSSSRNRFNGEFDNDNDYDSSSDSDDNADDDGSNNNNNQYNRQQGNENNRYPNNRPTRFRRNVNRPIQMQQSSDNMDMQRKHNMGTNRNNNRNNSSGNESSNSSACLTQCFFQEMKMANRDGFPDKHKVLQVITKEIRDVELKEFYVDSIQQCFHILEMEQSHEKCQFSRHLVNCLGERARANCDDFQNSIIF